MNDTQRKAEMKRAFKRNKRHVLYRGLYDRSLIIVGTREPTNHPGAEEVRAFWRRDFKAAQKAKPFDGSAASARARHRIDSSGKPRRPKVERKPVPLDWRDHVHPRQRRAFLFAHPEITKEKVRGR